MKTFVIDYELTTMPGCDVQIIHAKDESTAWDQAYEHSQKPGYSEGNFEMYMMLRNADGQLYLAETDGTPIKP